MRYNPRKKKNTQVHRECIKETKRYTKGETTLLVLEVYLRAQLVP